MRYFTRGWANGDLDDQEYDRVLAAYRQRLVELDSRLPPAMRELSRTSLHDAILEQVRWSPGTKQLVIRFVGGLQESAPFAMAATYDGAMLGESRITALRDVARSTSRRCASK